MIQQTSLMAFEKIKSQLSRLRGIVLTDIFNHPGTTAGESANRLKAHGLQQNSVSPRFAELESLGVIQADIVPRKCSISGCTVLTYQLSGNLPKNLGKRESSKAKIQRLESEIVTLRAENERLNQKLAHQGISQGYLFQEHKPIIVSKSPISPPGTVC